MTDVAGRNSGVALVTGAARRIGRCIAETLAAAGYSVVLHASPRSIVEAEQAAADIRARGGQAAAIATDLEDIAGLAEFWERASEPFGAPSVLVNSASIFEPDSPFAVSGEGWDRQFAINLRAPLTLAAELARTLPEGSKGSIVNIVDQRVERPNPFYFSYTLTKAALWTATRTLAQAFAPKVRVNAVGPGPVLPNVNEGGEAFLREAEGTPLEKSVTPEEIADAVLYLVRAQSVTGQLICVDSGQHIAWKTPDVLGGYGDKP